MATRKIFNGHSTSGLSGGGIKYFPPVAWKDYGPTLDMPCVVAGHFRNMKVALTVAPGVGKSRTFTFYVNGVATGLTVTISGASTAASSATSITVADGDTITVRETDTGAASSEFTFSIEHDSTTACQSLHGGGSDDIFGITAAYFNPLTHVGHGADPTVTPASTEAIVAVAGTFDKWSIRLDTAPGSSKSRTFVIYKNGVVQDGTGGTPNTTITISNAATTGSATFSLSVSANDELWAKMTPTNSPASCVCATGLRFTSGVDGLSMTSFDNPGNDSNNSADYKSYPGDSVAWVFTEADVVQLGPTTSMVIGDLYLKFASACQRKLTLRRNSLNTTLIATTSGSNAQKVQDTTHTVTIANGDTWTWRDDDIGGGFQRTVWGFSMYVDPSSLPKPWIYRPHTSTRVEGRIQRGLA